jgi:hypothetical protein
VIDVLERPPVKTPQEPAPSGWYDPDSSAYEPLAGASAVNDAMASSLEADRTVDAPASEADPA